MPRRIVKGLDIQPARGFAPRDGGLFRVFELGLYVLDHSDLAGPLQQRKAGVAVGWVCRS
jgi:hypothetical protein